MYWAVILSKTLPEPIFQKITGPSVFMTLIPLLTPPFGYAFVRIAFPAFIIQLAIDIN